MYVRLAFAVAAHLEPEILIVDEVLAVGDAEFQKKCLGKMGDVSRKGRTVLFVSHNMAAVEHLCRRVLVLEDGRNVFDGSSQDAIATYLEAPIVYSSTSLESRLDRQGTGRILFTNAWVEDAHGNRVETVRSGQEIRLVADTAQLPTPPFPFWWWPSRLMIVWASRSPTLGVIQGARGPIPLLAAR